VLVEGEILVGRELPSRTILTSGLVQGSQGSKPLTRLRLIPRPV
jgi:hypothetical protein